MTLADFISLRADLAKLGASTSELRLHPGDIAELEFEMATARTAHPYRGGVVMKVLGTSIYEDYEVTPGGLGLR